MKKLIFKPIQNCRIISKFDQQIIKTPIFLKEALVELPPAVLTCCWLSAVARSNSSVTRGLAPQFLTRAFLPGEKNDSENDQSLAQPPQECGGAPFTGDFQDATVQGASR